MQETVVSCDAQTDQEVPSSTRIKRAMCSQCLRPLTACWCSELPQEPLSVYTHVLILQHPNEASRKIRTARILELALEPTKVTTVRQRRFTEKNCSVSLWNLLTSPSTYLLFPAGSESTKDISKMTEEERQNVKAVVVLDGTWAEAKSMFGSSEVFHSMAKISLPTTSSQLVSEVSSERLLAPSEFRVRTQPNSQCVSTVEAVARALCILESRKDLLEILLSPLKKICDIQLHFGAVHHHDKVTKALKRIG